MEEDNIQQATSPKQQPTLDGVVLGHRVCQTKEAKWLCIENIYEKFYRPNMYDIGGTYIQDVADFWFLCQTENVGNIFLLHLFISNRHDASFNVAVSSTNDIKFEKKTNIAYLVETFLERQFRDCSEMGQHYISTYSFPELDVEDLRDKTLYIAVQFSSTDQEAVRPQVIEKAKYRHDLKHLLSDPVCSDFVIESSDGEKFNVHKVILTAHSEVFKAMLKDDTAESQNNYVKLVDVGAEDCRYLLEFIYTGTITDIENANLFMLLMLADQYNLDGLRELTQYILTQQLCEDNVLEVLIAADMYNSEMLKIAALKFIKKNMSVLKSSTLKEIKNPDLLRNICEYIVPS